MNMTPEQVLQQYFGFPTFRGQQKRIIDRLVSPEGGDVLVLMPTGGGKSLCYQIPALMMEGGTLVVSPLIALMQDQVDALRRRGIPATFINSTVSREDRESRLQRFVDGEYRLLYVTPERFRKPEFVEAIRSARVALLAVDEAHCVSQWGHDFRPDYSRMGEFRALLGNPRTIALTATATHEVQVDIIEKLGLQRDQVEVIHQGIDRPNLRLEAREVDSDREKFERIISTLTTYPGSGIVYFSLIQTLEKFSMMLGDKGYQHGVYHGRLSAAQRKGTQRRFMAGEKMLMLATNAFGMGIDKSDIRFIVHAEVPSSVESYYQEIGRAGRDGKDSLCLLLYDQEDLAIQMEFVKWSNPNAGFYSRLYGLLGEAEINSLGHDYLREQLNFKHRRDFRLETALGMLDRYGVTEGSLDERNLEVLGALPDELQDEAYLNDKLMRDNRKLLSMVQYFRTDDCRRRFVSDYFGFPGREACGNCDRCDAESDS